MESPSLVNVPAEILHLIIQSLDPVSLIDLSQTSSFLRWFINPQPTHFVQRLLAFELTPEHGGIVPHFRARLSTLSPPTDSQEWNSNKYACTGCMKLLPHQMFDNHSILGLGLRKPPHGSEEGERLTDWEPQGDPVARWKRLQSRGPAERERLEKSRQQYISAIRCNRPVGVQGFLAGIDDDARDDALAEAAEKVLCGRSRHKRLCIECKRKRGFYTRRTRSNIGSSEVPVIKSRQLQFADALSRSFSRTIYPDIPEPPSPRIFRVQRPQARSSLITTLMVFCRHCSTWQELADFRAGTECPLEMNTNIDDPKKSKYLSKLRCNNCFALENGSEKLGAELVQIFTNKAEEELDLIQRRLQFGWGRISTEFCEKGSPLNRPKYKATLRCILDPYHNRDVKRIRSRFESSCEQAYRSVRDMDGPASDPQVASTEDSAVKERLALRRRLKHFRRFLDKEADSADRHRVTDSWQGSWIEDYGKLPTFTMTERMRSS